MTDLNAPASIPPPPRRSARKPKGEGGARRAEILSAAERIFVAHGYDGATIRKIADAVGLSSTALYMHFADKDEILSEICRNAFAALLDAHRDIQAEDAPPEARLRRMMRAYADFGFANPDAYRLIYMTRPNEADSARNAAQGVGHELFQSLEAAVGQAVADGRLRGDPRVISQAVWAGAHGVVSLMITKPYFGWVERDRLVDAMTEALFAGFAAPADQGR